MKKMKNLVCINTVLFLKRSSKNKSIRLLKGKKLDKIHPLYKFVTTMTKIKRTTFCLLLHYIRENRINRVYSCNITKSKNKNNFI